MMLLRLAPITALLISILAHAQVPAVDPSPGGTLEDGNLVIRTPAKRYGSSYSVKITLRRAGFTYDIPVWIKPDQKISSLDRDQLSELGWTYADVRPEGITLSGDMLEVPKFTNIKSEWAYIPDFPRSCCYGILGQDVLKDYEIRFDPNPPSHLEWKRIAPEGIKIKVSPKIQKDLASLFSIRTTHAQVGRKKIDLTHTPYWLNLKEGTLKFEDERVDKNAASKPLKEPIFHYEFIPPVRQVLVISLPAKYQKSAKKVGFKSSLKVISVNQVKVSGLDHFELVEYLTGRNSRTLDIATLTHRYTFDFEKNEFTQSEPLQSTVGRN